MVTRRTFLGAIGTVAACAAAAMPMWSKSRSVTVGVCSKEVADVVKYGFDYIEPSAADIAAMSEEQFRDFSKTVMSSPIRCEAFNSFIRRKDLVVVGENVPTQDLRDYMDLCLAR